MAGTPQRAQPLFLPCEDTWGVGTRTGQWAPLGQNGFPAPQVPPVETTLLPPVGACPLLTGQGLHVLSVQTHYLIPG